MFFAGSSPDGFALGATKRPTVRINSASGDSDTTLNANVPPFLGRCGRKSGLTLVAIVVGLFLEIS